MFVSGGSEEYYMNLIADAMIPYLQSSGIQYTRNTKEMTAASSIIQSNSGRYDLHLAIHSNAAPEAAYGTYRGIDVYYSPGSPLGRAAANIFVRNLKSVYPVPSDVRALPTTTIGEVRDKRFKYSDQKIKNCIPEWIKSAISSVHIDLAADHCISIAKEFLMKMSYSSSSEYLNQKMIGKQLLSNDDIQKIYFN